MRSIFTCDGYVSSLEVDSLAEHDFKRLRAQVIVGERPWKAPQTGQFFIETATVIALESVVNFLATAVPSNPLQRSDGQTKEPRPKRPLQSS